MLGVLGEGYFDRLERIISAGAVLHVEHLPSGAMAWRLLEGVAAVAAGGRGGGSSGGRDASTGGRVALSPARGSGMGGVRRDRLPVDLVGSGGRWRVGEQSRLVTAHAAVADPASMAGGVGVVAGIQRAGQPCVPAVEDVVDIAVVPAVNGRRLRSNTAADLVVKGVAAADVQCPSGVLWWLSPSQALHPQCGARQGIARGGRKRKRGR